MHAVVRECPRETESGEFMIDLHTHTNLSDGSYSPAQLIEYAVKVGIEILAITDHDNFAGYDEALAMAQYAGLELICGIEISTKFENQSVHVLGYFFDTDHITELRSWIEALKASRRERNIRLAARLRELGIACTLEEAEARGRGMTGRPHFAQILVEKGYVETYQKAFDYYLDESAEAYVPRIEPTLIEGVARIRQAGGVASLAHPVRLKRDLRSLMPLLRDSGINAIEAFHSDHTAEQTESYAGLARAYGLLVTGGSDFHGTSKPDVQLGTGRDKNLRIPMNLVERLKTASGSESHIGCCAPVDGLVG